jgi:regulator of protease activity HflC (stomatin/prohibitin superfamily)
LYPAGTLADKRGLFVRAVRKFTAGQAADLQTGDKRILTLRIIVYYAVNGDSFYYTVLKKYYTAYVK